MKLRKQDQEFRNPRIFYADPKNVDLDRVLVVLFLWLKTNGMRPRRRSHTLMQRPSFRETSLSLAFIPQ